MLRLKKPNIRRQILHRFAWIKDGTITGGSDDDPSGIITYTQAGASGGFSMLWLIVLLTPILIAIESMASRLAIIKKEGLAFTIKKHYGFKWAAFAVVILVLSNLLSSSADLAAMAEILSLWTDQPVSLWVIFIALSILLLLLRGNFKFVSLLLFSLTPFLLLYLFSAFLAKPDLVSVGKGFLPNLSEGRNLLELALAVIGTTISPYLIFWQASEEAEEHKTIKELREEDRGVAFGMIYSDLISLFIIIAAGATLFKEGIEINTAREAALSLKPLLGGAAFSLYSLGILFAGAVGVPVLIASACYAVSDLFSWSGSLDKKEWQAVNFYAFLVLLVLFAAGIASLNYSPLALVIFSQALQGILIPILIYILWRLNNDQRIVGRWKNSHFNNFFAWVGILLTALMAVIYLVKTLCKID